MSPLEDQLKQLAKVSPSRSFRRQAKDRLLHQIQFSKHENWFVLFLKRLGQVLPRPEFLIHARVRLLQSMVQVRPALGWIIYFKRLAASTMVLILAASATLFYVDGRQMASASDDSYLEVFSGEVFVKRADRLTWDKVGTVTSVAAGDLIQVGENGLATFHFFDDSELRLAGNSLLLINQLHPSPVFARQGKIDVMLSSGKAWVQTLNALDGFAGFGLSTHDGAVAALNASFDVITGPNQPTLLRVLRNSIHLKRLEKPLAAGHKIHLSGANQNPRILADTDQADPWIQNNLAKDRDHLVVLRDREFAMLKKTTGVLPGQVLYPLKLAKERLQLAFSFGDDDLTQTQIEIANKRLNEAIVLLEKGNRIKAHEALMAYQSMTRNLVQAAQDNQMVRDEINTNLIAKNQKVLVAALPMDPPVQLVTEALNHTEELIAENPLEQERVRLHNTIERLAHIEGLIHAGETEAAKEALAQHQLSKTTLLEQAAALSDLEAKKEVFAQALELRQEEAELLEKITLFAQEQNWDTQLTAMAEQATQAAELALSEAVDFIAPYAPELVYQPSVPSLADQSVLDFVERLTIYKTWQGQKNQLARLFRENPPLKYDVDFLRAVSAGLSDARTQDLVDGTILEAKAKERLSKHKSVQRRIDRAQRLRRESEL